uniref:Transcriptional activator protein n=1 Tax=Pepper yellow vein Mali virus TaxID=260378 RepID=A4Q9L8_9GEMI|nr:AC2 protein [Pepper yellow vein Mali virus]CAM84525.1 AC2 protein [Pepper yellow vein Mali virus]CAM84560.1 AC2 protein [Pepper yellow vein Mali virus]
MQPSSPSTGHSTQVPIKVIHRRAKTKAIRRKRIDLDCGCSYYLHIDCINHGFTHRGVHHCSSGREWRVYLGTNQSPVFQDHQTRQQTIPTGTRHHYSSDTVQLQPAEGFGDTQMFSDLPDLDSLTTSDIEFLKGL